MIGIKMEILTQSQKLDYLFAPSRWNTRFGWLNICIYSWLNLIVLIGYWIGLHNIYFAFSDLFYDQYNNN